MLTKQSLIEWAAAWVPGTERARFVEGLTQELENWQPPPAQAVFCKHCPFAQHVHYEEEGKLVTPTCPGFEAR